VKKSENSQDRLRVRAALKAAGLQVTAQRLAVYQAVESSPHCAADEVCQAVRAELGAISRQAVFDALNVMSDSGIIRRIAVTVKTWSTLIVPWAKRPA